MMPWQSLPIDDLPAWALLNNVSFTNVKVAQTEDKGYGVVTTRHLVQANADEATPDGATALLTVPHDLVLNQQAVHEYAKEDKNFRQLLEAVGHRSARADVLLFLLVQSALASRSSYTPVGVSNPWAQYLRFLPETVLVPTLWNEDERLLLRGTSLEPAIDAKLSALDAEFGLVREKSCDLPCWNELLWQQDDGQLAEGAEIGAFSSPTPSFTDWIRLDALYRSRCLELPGSGEAMVPCIDMINHSSVSPSAYYEENAQDEVVLLLRPGVSLPAGAEVTISYGDVKPAAEMLFNYGFIDPQSASERLVLPLRPFSDDPLAKAKLVAFGRAPTIHVARELIDNDGNSTVRWDSAFAYLMCVNEEDGLEFRILQQTDGTQNLCVFWQGIDVTDRTTDFQTLIQTHALHAVLRLRVVTVVHDRLQEQLDRMRSCAVPDAPLPSQRKECYEASILLRRIEGRLLEDAIKTLEEERNSLLQDKNVVAYLGLTEPAKSDLVDQEAANEEDDFS